MLLRTRVHWLLLIAILLLFPVDSWSAISFVRSGGTTGTSFSLDIGTASTNRLVVVFAGDESETGNNLDGITVDGKNCNLVTRANNTVGIGNHQEMWYCDEDDLGSSNGTVTVAILTPPPGDAGWAIHAHLYTGVSQNGFTDSGIDDTSVDTTITVTNITVPANGLVVMGAGQGSSGSFTGWTSPLIERTDGPNPSSAVLATASVVESSAQTNKTYVATASLNFNRGTGIVAAWPQSGGDVTVSSSGSQISTLDIPSTDNYVGGTFVITDNTGSRNVTGITITENGTVDAQNDLANVKLFYDLDTTAPYDCASESYVGSESQFGTTTSFNGADGTASFTGSVAISTTQTMCVYVVLDVGSGATDGETLEIEINNPTSDVTISSGSIESNTAFVRSGGTTGTSFSMDIGSAGTNRLVVVTADDESDGNSLSVVTVDGKSCTKVTEADNPSGIGNHLEMWYCDEDDLGSSSGSVTIAIQGGNSGWATHAFLFTGADQSGPNGSAVDDSTTSGTSVTTETSISVSNGDLVATAAGQGSSGSMATPGSPLTRAQDGPNPSSAVKGTAYVIESRTGSFTYTDNFTNSINRATMIAAVWSPENTVALSGTTTLNAPLTLGDFSYCKKITIDNTKVSGSSNHSNFPVLINLTEDYLRTTGNGGDVTDADGDDIVFIDSDGSTQLDHEVEKYDGSTGELVAWGRVPILDYNNDTVIYMYYGNSNITTSQENVTGVWDSNYKMVQHLQETSGTHYDSTANNNDDTGKTVNIQGGDIGKIDGADDFAAGSSNQVSFPTIGLSTSAGTVSIWVNVDQFSAGTRSYFFSHRPGSEPNRIYLYEQGGASSGNFYIGFANVFQNDTGYSIPADEWHFYVLRWSGTNWYAYVDGNLQANSSNSGLNNLDTASHLASYKSTGEYFDGIIDEVRISDTARSADWISTEYNNQDSPSTFYSVGSCSSATLNNWQEAY